MDQEVLVRSDIEIRGRILDALNRTGIPVTLCEWHYVPQLGEWQLIVATPWYDSRGPRVTYDRIIKALQQTGVYEDVPLRRVFLKSPSDPIVKQLEIEVKNKTEGVIHIIDHGGQYSVLFRTVHWEWGSRSGEAHLKSRRIAPISSGENKTSADPGGRSTI